MDERTVAEHWVLKIKLDKKGRGERKGRTMLTQTKNV